MYSVGVPHGRSYPSLCQRLVSLLLFFFLIHFPRISVIPYPPTNSPPAKLQKDLVCKNGIPEPILFPTQSTTTTPSILSTPADLTISSWARLHTQKRTCARRRAKARRHKKGGKAQRIFAQGLRVTLASFALTSSQSKLKNCFPSASSASNGPSTVPPPPSHTTSYSLAATVTWRSMS